LQGNNPLFCQPIKLAYKVKENICKKKVLQTIKKKLPKPWCGPESLDVGHLHDFAAHLGP